MSKRRVRWNHNRTQRWVEDDGGRKRAGFEGVAGDCVCRAISIALELPYRQVYDQINEAARLERPGSRESGVRSHARTGVYRSTYERVLRSHGWVFTPTMGIGTGCRVHLREGELPPGRIIARVSQHLVAVIDGVIHDTSDQTRGGTRCVYGYWSRASTG
ncbi:MAG: hypothetical protein E6R03_17035 [Hyphomicrobiaceae bacterium]|nr:MAG: hypothetical protein E6R03_17035 [Hyphomicrobiaceae bacterium]